MALHGLIEVNGLPIGGWSAERIEEEIGDTNTYKFGLTETVDGTYRFIEGTLTHDYKDGAAVLASKVLAHRPKDWPVGSKKEKRP